MTRGEKLRKIWDVLCTKEPWRHQLLGMDRMVSHDGWNCFWEQGCGKTLPTCVSIAYHYLTGRAKRVVIIAPNAPIVSWLRDLKRIKCPHHRIRLDSTFDGSVDKRIEALRLFKKPGLKIVLLNWEVVWKMRKALRQWKPDLIVFDESQRMQNHSSKVTKAMAFLEAQTPLRFNLTGTPIGNGPLGVWGQYRFTTPDVFGRVYKKFERRYAIMHELFKGRVRRYLRQKELRRLVHTRATRIKKRDCLDLPPVTTRECEVILKESRSAYKEMWDDFMTTVEETSVDASIPLVKHLRCQQICGGWVKNKDGEWVRAGREKERFVEEFLKDFPKDKKLVVFARFVPEIMSLVDLCRKLNITAEALHGATKNIDELLENFQEHDNPRVIVVQPKKGGEGIDLFRASTGLIYSTDHSWFGYSQMISRIDRPGQTEPVDIIRLKARCEADNDIYEAIDHKAQLSHYLLDKYKTTQRI